MAGNGNGDFRPDWPPPKVVAELRSLLYQLRPCWPGYGNYTHADQTRDFREVFYGSEAGKRVLQQIFAMTEGPVIGPEACEKTHYMAYRNGMRWVANLINKALSGSRAEPPTIENEAPNDA